MVMLDPQRLCNSGSHRAFDTLVREPGFAHLFSNAHDLMLLTHAAEFSFESSHL